jgi:Flp pilus assembly protein TadG
MKKMMNRRAQVRRFSRASLRQDGQALIELALTMPLLLLMLLGAGEFARMAYMAIELSNAAKAAAQYGAQNEAYAANTLGIQLVAQKDATYTSSFCNSFTTSVQTPLPCSCVVNGAVGAASTGACTAACAGYTVQVLVIDTSASCNPIIHAPGFPGSFTLRGHAQQEVLN